MSRLTFRLGMEADFERWCKSTGTRNCASSFIVWLETIYGLDIQSLMEVNE